jgi:hypothetical protein
LIALRAGDIDQDAPHQPRRHRQKVGAVLPVHLSDVDQPQIRLVDERRGLQGLAGSLAREASLRDSPQLTVHERHQGIEGGFVTLPPRQEKRGDLTRWARNGPILRPSSTECQFSTAVPASIIATRRKRIHTR